MRRYAIYHPTNMIFNHECQPGIARYGLVGFISADNINDAFVKSQNDFGIEYRGLGVRSTSVGDIIQSEEDREMGMCYLVEGAGFSHVSANWLRSNNNLVAA